MEGDAEAVNFVAHSLEKAQGLALFVDVERERVVGDVDFFEALGDADDGHLAVEVEVFEGLDGHA